MKLLVVTCAFFVLNSQLGAQDSFQECGIAKKKAMDSFFEMVQKKDSVNARKIMASVEPNWRECLIGKTIEGLSFQTIGGKRIDADELKGRVVVLNFWFTGCAPCILEMPALNRLVNEYKDSSVVFIGITFDGPDKLDYMLEKVKFDFTIVGNARTLIDSFGVNGYPTTIITDKNQVIKKIWLGIGPKDKIETEAYDRAKPVIDGLLKAE